MRTSTSRRFSNRSGPGEQAENQAHASSEKTSSSSARLTRRAASPGETSSTESERALWALTARALRRPSRRKARPAPARSSTSSGRPDGRRARSATPASRRRFASLLFLPSSASRWQVGTQDRRRRPFPPVFLLARIAGRFPCPAEAESSRPRRNRSSSCRHPCRCVRPGASACPRASESGPRASRPVLAVPARESRRPHVVQRRHRAPKRARPFRCTRTLNGVSPWTPRLGIVLTGGARSARRAVS